MTAKAKGAVKKRPAAAVDATDAAVKKRPAASGKHKAREVVRDIADIPFAKDIIMTDVFKELKKNGKGLKRGTFTCRVYDTGVRRMTKAGSSLEDAKAFGRIQLHLAGKLFNSL